MHEAVLKRFFLGEVSAHMLAADLDGSMIEGRDTTRHVIEDMRGEFEVRPEHLVSVCDAVLSGAFEARYLKLIGFCIAASDNFGYNTDTAEGSLVGETILDWSAPEVNYPLTIESVHKFRERLVTGRNPFVAEGAA